MDVKRSESQWTRHMPLWGVEGGQRRAGVLVHDVTAAPAALRRAFPPPILRTLNHHTHRPFHMARSIGAPLKPLSLFSVLMLPPSRMRTPPNTPKTGPPY